jgi:hypothetical protein
MFKLVLRLRTKHDTCRSCSSARVQTYEIEQWWERFFKLLVAPVAKGEAERTARRVQCRNYLPYRPSNEATKDRVQILRFARMTVLLLERISISRPARQHRTKYHQPELSAGSVAMPQKVSKRFVSPDHRGRTVSVILKGVRRGTLAHYVRSNRFNTARVQPGKRVLEIVTQSW